MDEDKIPDVKIYVQDKIYIAILCIALAAAVIVPAKEPTRLWEWITLAFAVAGGVTAGLLLRIFPTGRQAGALRFASEAGKQLSEFKVDQIVAAVERKDDLRTGAVPSVTP